MVIYGTYCCRSMKGSIKGHTHRRMEGATSFDLEEVALPFLEGGRLDPTEEEVIFVVAHIGWIVVDCC